VAGLAAASHGSSVARAKVIVGTGRLARNLARASQSPKALEPVLVGFVDEDDDGQAGGALRMREELLAPVLGGLDVVTRLARERRISHVVVARKTSPRPARGARPPVDGRWSPRHPRVQRVRGDGGTGPGTPPGRRPPRRTPTLPSAGMAAFREAGARHHRGADRRGRAFSGVRHGGDSDQAQLPGPILYKQKRVGRRAGSSRSTSSGAWWRETTTGPIGGTWRP